MQPHWWNVLGVSFGYVIVVFAWMFGRLGQWRSLTAIVGAVVAAFSTLSMEGKPLHSWFSVLWFPAILAALHITQLDRRKNANSKSDTTLH